MVCFARALSGVGERGSAMFQSLTLLPASCLGPTTAALILHLPSAELCQWRGPQAPSHLLQPLCGAPPCPMATLLHRARS